MKLLFLLFPICLVLGACGTFETRDQAAMTENAQFYRTGKSSSDLEAALEKLEAAKCRYLKDESLIIPDAGMFDSGSVLQEHRENVIVNHLAKVDGNLAIEKLGKSDRFNAEIKIYSCPSEYLRKVEQINEMIR